MRTYHPRLSEAKTWDYIEKRYIANWQDVHERLVELIRHIKSSDYKDRLYGSTSMDKLVISIYNPIDYDKEVLHITFDTWTRKWNFKYFAMPFQKPQFVRTYDEEQGIEKFDNFIKMLKWQKITSL
ncbi:hypothetical protein SAMN05216474_2484 [Lishizhenia tianjinensis]|uniref:DUF5655 domain-containing protein n=1 Tax=Lishizhenia tianjinensis TaxID=477690 RepID=A0A1I7B2I5_9FLAO|nr:hypothetical protein [Lishizhenia tianjinensis]SFT81314.1 hypothetical protein SAMN05216474_2484 [Lishizhenia tianjinensis]